MYWIIGSFILITMMGVLAVADGTTMSINSLLMDSVSTPVIAFALIFLTLVLGLISQLHSPASHNNTSAKKFSSQNILFSRVIYFSLIVLLASLLIIGSAIQALIHHQQAEATKITEPMRVQALVQIEGISDSVYDASSGIGYRQVATIRQLSPLVSDMTAQDLDKIAANHQKESNNSLSGSKHAIKTNDANAKEYRVLLNAYPKKSTKQPSTSSSKKNVKKKSKKVAKQNQITDLNHLQPGDELFMTLTLAPLATSEQAINNPSGFDSYRWLRGRHIDGVATIIATSSTVLPSSYSISQALPSDSYITRLRTAIDQGRWQLRQHFYQDWTANTAAEQQAKAVTLSLLTGDRSLISHETKELYQLAGISHLLAISGTHILFLAIVLAGMVVFLLNRFYPALYQHIPRWHVRWWVMVGAALIYALFTGFDVPAARTAWMLLAIGLVRLTLLPISTMRVLFALAILMAWQDPYVLWQAGYWLSFIAVALLLKYEDSSEKQSLTSHKTTSAAIHQSLKRLQYGFIRLFKLQGWLFLALLPVTLLLFGKASLWGLLINLFAIGLFGWVIVPLNLLAGIFYLIAPSIAAIIWALVITIVSRLHELIIWLTTMPALSDAWLYTPVNIAILLMVLLAMLPWFLPRGFISRWLAVPLMSLLVMTVYANQQSSIRIPSLYILPTGDSYISAALLRYPASSVKETKDISWSFLADHRPSDGKTMASSLTADGFSITLQRQLGSLGVSKLEGLVVQSSSSAVTDIKTHDKKSSAFNPNTLELLPMMVAHLSERLPVNQYWQAGHSERWSALQKAYKVSTHSQNAATISAQRCESGKIWQSSNKDLTVQAMTGWSKINDASVWDCTVAIDSSIPIQVINYNAANPLKPLPSKTQTLISSSEVPTDHVKKADSRLILNADTHQRIWKMWELLCSNQSSSATALNHTAWLGHSTSNIPSELLNQQQISETITYDNKSLEAALSSNVLSKENIQ